MLHQERGSDLRRRPFRRLPIPASLLITFSPESKLGDSLTTQQDCNDLSTTTSPPSAQAKEEKRYSLSPPPLPSGLFGFVRRKTLRNRRASENSPCDQLSPSPPSRTSLPLLLSHPSPPAVVATTKVLKRKPIPPSLFTSLTTDSESKQRSFSLPDIFSDYEQKVHLAKENQLGLYYPNSRFDSDTDTSQIEVTTNTNTKSIKAQEFVGLPQPRLRRESRCVSDTRYRASIDKGIVDNEKRTFPRQKLSSVTDITDFDLEANSGPTDNSNLSTPRSRARRGSESTLSLAHPSNASDCRISLGGAEHTLRRVSKQRPNEMRSSCLTPPSLSASPSGPHYTSQPLPIQFPSYQPSDTFEVERVEILRTPEPNPSFETMGSSSLSNPSLSSSVRRYDTFRSTTTSWDGSFASRRGRSSSETSMASLMVLQQHIQQMNYLRQFAPPSADPNLPEEMKKRSSGLQISSREDMEKTQVEAEVKTKKSLHEAMGKVEKVVEKKENTALKSKSSVEEGEAKAVRQYGAVRIKDFPSVSDDDDECGLPYLSSNRSSPKQNGSPKGGGLRHMFSNPLFPDPIDNAVGETTSDGVANDVGANITGNAAPGSLRERRSKPPITITTLPPTTPAPTAVEAVIMGPAIPLRKKLSKGHLLSPT